MINFFKRKILFLSDHPMSFGDSLTSIIRFDSYVENTDIVHYCLHPITASCIYWFLNGKHVQCDRLISQYDHNYYDIIVLENFYNTESLNISPYKLYRGISCSDPSIEMFGKPEINRNKRNDRLSVILENTNQSICIFPFSTRPLANIGIDGLNRIAKQFPKQTIFLCGENRDVYSENSYLNQQLSPTYLDKINNRIINLLGMGTQYNIDLCNLSNKVIMAPTGIAMVSILNLINTETIILDYGDTDIMHAIYNGYPTKNPSVKFERTQCPLFPCGNSNKAKAIECKNNKIAECLNKEIKIAN